MPAWKRRHSVSVKDRKQPDKHKLLLSNEPVRRQSGEHVKKQPAKRLLGVNVRGWRQSGANVKKQRKDNR